MYIGVTSNLFNRVTEHKSGEGSVFTKRYNCFDLVYFECYQSIEEAISREKQLKNWKRAWKDDLIKQKNPELTDLSQEAEDYR